jgi:hypothetical protein
MKRINLLIFLLLLVSCTPDKFTTLGCNPFPPSLPLLSEQQKESLLKTTFKAMADATYNTIPQFPSSFERQPFPVVVTLRSQGKVVSQGTSSTDNLELSVYKAARNAFLSSPQINSPLTMEITILSVEGKQFPPHNYAWGVHALLATSPNASATLLAKEFVENNYNRDRAIAILCGRIGKTPTCPADADVHVLILDELTFNFNPSTNNITTFYRGNPVDCTPQSLKEVDDVHNLGKRWLLTHVQEDGLWPYLYYPSTGATSNKERNTDLRQAMPARLLALYASQNASLLQLHQKNLDALLTMYKEKDGHGYMWYWNESKLNTNALVLRALVASPFFEEYSSQAKKLADVILEQQHPNGSFTNWFIPPGEERNEHFLTWNGRYKESYFLAFSSGEAILALTEYYLKTHDVHYVTAAIKSQKYYLKEYVERMEQNYHPAYVPWHTQSLYDLYLITGNRSYADAVFILNDRVLELQDNGSSYYDYRGRFYNPATQQYGSPHSSSDGVFTEGLAYAYRLAVLLNDSTRASTYRESILRSFENLERLQFTDEKMYYLSQPERVEGAMRTSITNNIVRVDNTQHMLDAVGAFLDFEGRPHEEITEENIGYTLMS